MAWGRLAGLTLLAFAVGCTGPSPDTPSPQVPVHDAAIANSSDTALPESASPALPPLAELLGNVRPSEDSAFAELPARMSSREGLYLRTEACDAFVAMHDSALADGIRLTALSATRTFGHQRSIWNRKWARPQYMGWSDIEKAQDILLYSSMPGSSRHHWGTDVDIHSLEPSDFIQGDGAQVVAWLRKTAHHFGFAEVYIADPRRTGYQPEAWHWSYMPLANRFLGAINDARNEGLLPAWDGFEGAHTADSLRIVEDYINGVNPLVLP
jgi:D-alanyl-D-alanine carboxypeptidase